MGFEPLNEYLTKYLNELSEKTKADNITPGIPSGLIELDRLLNGFQNGCIYLIGGDVASGKTNFMLSLLAYQIENNYGALFITGEDTINHLLDKLIAKISKIPTRKITSGFLNQEEIEKITNIVEKISKKNLFLRRFLSVEEIISILKTNSRFIDIVYIDNISLLSYENKGSGNRYHELIKAIKELKYYASSFGIPIVISDVAYIENRSDKRLRLTDLRYYKTVGELLDVVILIYRPELYKRNLRPEEEGIAELIVAKNRTGNIGTIKMAFMKETQSFENLPKEYFEKLRKIEESRQRNNNDDDFSNYEIIEDKLF